MKTPRLLTIAGSDSGGGAGIQADLKTFSALGGYGMSVITAVTAQNTLGVHDVCEIDPDFVGKQIDAVISDIGVDAVKIGMLSNKKVVRIVAERLRVYQVDNIVLDPVMISTSGAPLLKPDAVLALCEELMPMAKVLTPNISEAECLLRGKINSQADIQGAATALLSLGPEAVLIKGGHSGGKHSDDGLAYKKNEDVVFEWIRGHRVDTPNTHGTGCTLSSAIASYLGSGSTIVESVRAAKQYLAKAIEAGAKHTIGRGVGPVAHFYNWHQKGVR